MNGRSQRLQGPGFGWITVVGAFLMRAAARFVVLLSGVLIFAFAPGISADDRPAGATAAKTPAVIRIGAVAYAPSAVTIFEGIRRYFDKHDQPTQKLLLNY